MHFSAFVLAALPAVVRGLTLFSDFNCGREENATNATVGCFSPQTCQSFAGFHSFQSSGVTIPEYVQTYESNDCSSPPAGVNFIAPPNSCVSAITGAYIGSYKCQLSPYDG